MPQPAHKPSKESRKLVRTLAGYGVTHEDIAATLEISQPTLRKYYSEDMAKGDALAKGKIGEKVYEKAMAGDTTMLIFLAKVRLGFKETSVTRLENADGSNVSFTFKLDSAGADDGVPSPMAGRVPEEGTVH